MYILPTAFLLPYDLTSDFSLPTPYPPHVCSGYGQVRPARGDKGVSFSVLRTELGLKALLKRKALTQRQVPRHS